MNHLSRFIRKTKKNAVAGSGLLLCSLLALVAGAVEPPPAGPPAVGLNRKPPAAETVGKIKELLVSANRQDIRAQNALHCPGFAVIKGFARLQTLHCCTRVGIL